MAGMFCFFLSSLWFDFQIVWVGRRSEVDILQVGVRQLQRRKDRVEGLAFDPFVDECLDDRMHAELDRVAIFRHWDFDRGTRRAICALVEIAIVAAAPRGRSAATTVGFYAVAAFSGFETVAGVRGGNKGRRLVQC
jgi:hypothetical protein